MYTIKLPGGDLLDLAPGTQISFELQNSIFSGSDTSTLPGSFSFPIDIPSSPTNRRALGFPDLVTTPGNPAPIADVWVYAAGQAMFNGTLTIRSANIRTISVNIVSNPLKDLKNITLKDIDLGGNRSFGANDATRKALMLNTVTFPENYDFSFLTVFNTEYWQGETPSPLIKNLYSNYFDSTLGAFDFECLAIMPMLKLEYLLERIINTAAADFYFENKFQITKELRRLYLYNNFTLWQEGTGALELPDTFNLVNHVSKTNAGDFLKKVVELFALGIFVNIFDKKIELIPLAETLSKPVKHDWTNYAADGYAIHYEEQNAPGTLCHQEIDDIYPGFVYQGDIDELTSFMMEEDLDAALGSIPDGLYYVETKEAIFQVQDDGAGQYMTEKERRRRCIQVSDADALTFKMKVLSGNSSGVNDYTSPQAFQTGNHYQETDIPGTFERQEADTEDALFFFRGIQPVYADGTGDDIPFSSVTPWTPYAEAGEFALITTDGVTEAEAEHSLLLDGENGLYEKFWKSWLDVSGAAKPVTLQLLLPVSVLTSFSFKDKIRILNMDYFVKSLRIQKLYPDSKFLIEARLFSVI